jgi:hypothetical protein
VSESTLGHATPSTSATCRCHPAFRQPFSNTTLEPLLRNLSDSRNCSNSTIETSIPRVYTFLAQERPNSPFSRRPGIAAEAAGMPPSTTTFNSWRLRSYLLRLPLFTRIVLVVIILAEIIGFQSVWDIRQWGALIPDQLSIFNGTFPRAQTPRLRPVLTWLPKQHTASTRFLSSIPISFMPCSTSSR